MEIKPFYSGRAYYDITTNTGEKYVFVPQEFVQKGFVQGGQQFYSPGFLTPGAMDSAQAFVLPDDSAVTGAAKSIYKEPTKGFVWKADDFNKINYDDFSIKTYQPTDKYGTIKALTIKDGVPYYAQEPSPGSNYTLLDKDGVSTATTLTVTRSGGGGGGGGFFGALMRGDVGGALSMLDPTTAISRELTNLYQPVEKTISKELAQLDKDLSLSKNAPIIAAVALAVVVPVIGAEVGASLMEAGYLTSAANASNAVLAAGGTAAQAAAAAASATATATAVGTAIASATAQVAQGIPVEDAIRNATVAATVQLNAPGAAKTVNDIVGNPAVTNLVVSTAASVVQTAATGGNEADIIRNAKGALVGSGVTSATDSNIAGRAVGGGVTGGVAGALVGAAGAAGAGKDVREEAAAIEKEQDATSIVPPAKPDVVSTAEQDIRNLMANISPGVQTADMSGGIIAMPPGVRDETAEKLKINLPRIGSDMTIVDPETQGTLRDVIVTAPRDESITFQEGQPNLPELDRTGEGLVILSDKAATGGGSSVSPADQAVIDLIKPSTSPASSTLTTFSQPATAGAGVDSGVFGSRQDPGYRPGVYDPIGDISKNVTRYPTDVYEGSDTDYIPPYGGLPVDQAIIDLIGIGGANVGGNVVVGPGADAGAGNAAGNVIVGPGAGEGGNAAGNVIVGPGDGGGGPGGNVTIDAGGGGGNATSNVSGNVVVDEPPVEEVAPPAEEEKPPAEEEKPPEEDEKPPEEEDKPPGEKEEPYKPDLFIYSGKTPKPRPRTNLGTTLQAPFAPSTTLGQALTGYRGAGEIEGKKTGKPRRDVWNEESLRLKDALGL